ncbi:hypothetical protein ACFLUU_10690, partial [Chloroflexota bacterium]
MSVVLTEEQENDLLPGFKSRVLRQGRALGAKQEEVQEICDKIKTKKDWCPEFTRFAEEYEKMGDDAEDAEAKVSNYVRSLVYYHMGEQYIYLDNEEKKTTYRRMISVFCR